MSSSKQQLRREIRQKKRAMTESEIREKSTRLAQMFFDTEQYRNARSLYGYLPFNQEVRTQPILEQALRDGKRVALPRCIGKEMIFIWVEDFDHLEKSEFGAPQPALQGPSADDPSALVLMPGLVFDRAGNRIGYGGGYYDRFLAQEPNHPTVALCYDFQLVEQLETDEFDIPADRILRA